VEKGWMGRRIITREELHRLVWTHRMADVAADLLVSSNELDVLIATLDVPFPFSGYWSRTAAGRAKPPRLRAAKPDTPDSVEITSPPPRRASNAPRPVANPPSLAEEVGPSEFRRLVRPHA
jgi:hypothetical protein